MEPIWGIWFNTSLPNNIIDLRNKDTGAPSVFLLLSQGTLHFSRYILNGLWRGISYDTGDNLALYNEPESTFLWKASKGSTEDLSGDFLKL